MVDTGDLKSLACISVPVRVRPSVPLTKQETLMGRRRQPGESVIKMPHAGFIGEALIIRLSPPDEKLGLEPCMLNCSDKYCKEWANADVLENGEIVGQVYHVSECQMISLIPSAFSRDKAPHISGCEKSSWYQSCNCHCESCGDDLTYCVCGEASLALSKNFTAKEALEYIASDKYKFEIE